MRVTHGLKENRFRPAVDPLFRSAAYSYGSRVIGIVLSGSLDDGTAGLWTIKRRGGTAIVQDLSDAAVAAMPKNALEAVNVDFIVSVADMGGLLVQISKGLFNKIVVEIPDIDRKENSATQLEVKIALQEAVHDENTFTLGKISPYTCPDCHGVLTAIKENDRTRFRCHTGHAFSADSLLYNLTETIENDLWNVIREMEESRFLLNYMGDHFSSINNPRIAAAYFKKAQEAETRIKLLRQVTQLHEQLSDEEIEGQEQAQIKID